jgi:hypothetical protein
MSLLWDEKEKEMKHPGKGVSNATDQEAEGLGSPKERKSLCPLLVRRGQEAMGALQGAS